MKIYTRTGDDGTTGLIGGARARKDDARIDAYGTVDELNATLGLARAAGAGDLDDALAQAQDDLFVLGARLAAADPARAKHLPELPADAVARLERLIDAHEAELPALTTFILPGGTELAARLHVARTVCRRAERLVVALGAEAGVVAYLNRLSDWLFCAARAANARQDHPEIAWPRGETSA